MVDWSHFLVPALAALGVVLGHVILTLVRKRNGHGAPRLVAHDDDGNGGRITMRDLRDDIRSVRDISQANAAKLGLLERDVDWIKKSLGLNGIRK